MARHEVPAPGRGHDKTRPSIDYLRKRSLHRLWWNSARVAVRRGPSGTASAPTGHGSIGKRG